MFSYTKRYVSIVSFLISIIIFFIISKINFLNLHHISNIANTDEVLVKEETNSINQGTREENITLKNTTQTNEEDINWKIIIPKILLEAEICEGTSNDVMDKYVGHFEETALKDGNIGLAAHNRGYSVNYFSEIRLLEEGDEITYKYYDFERTYEVFKNIIILDEDWSYLEETEENTITLITCVENQPEYRRCIQAIEKKKEEI